MPSSHCSDRRRCNNRRSMTYVSRGILEPSGVPIGANPPGCANSELCASRLEAEVARCLVSFQPPAPSLSTSSRLTGDKLMGRVFFFTRHSTTLIKCREWMCDDGLDRNKKSKQKKTSFNNGRKHAILALSVQKQDAGIYSMYHAEDADSA